MTNNERFPIVYQHISLLIHIVVLCSDLSKQDFLPLPIGSVENHYSIYFVYLITHIIEPFESLSKMTMTSPIIAIYVVLLLLRMH